MYQIHFLTQEPSQVHKLKPEHDTYNMGVYTIITELFFNGLIFSAGY